jgi:anaerobic dimethyl sulfoxide reductase subunit C (anchor subunit)
MGMGWHEWPLMIFTVLGQCVVGGFTVMALALLSGRLDRDMMHKVHRSMFFLWLLMGIAFVASVIHLGSPLRAMNSLNRVGASALSNEIAAGSLFFALGGIYWLLAMLDKLPPALTKPWLIITMLAGFVFVYAMCRVYAINTVPTWDNVYTPLGFVLTVFMAGPLLGYLLLRVAGVTQCGNIRLLPALSVLALVITLCAAMMQIAGLADITSSVQSASALIPGLGWIMTWRLVLVVLGLGCWICPLVMRKTPSISALSMAFVLVVAGELIGRGVFYGLHMTMGMAIGS